MKLGDKAVIVGIGGTESTLKDCDTISWAQAIEAGYKAVQDAGLSVKDIGAILEAPHPIL